MSVRRAGPDDAPALARLRFAWRAGERGESGIDEGRFHEDFSCWLVEHAASHRAFVAETGGEAAGMAFLAVVHRIPGPGRWNRLSGNLQSLYVLPAHRGHGLGAALVDAVVAEARREGLDYVVVHPSEQAFPLYRRAGFAESAGALELDLRGGA